MKLTNKFGLPKALVNFARRDPYSRGAAHISVTELIDSPRVVELRHAHDAERTEDVSDKLWMLVGRALHSVCELSSEDIEHLVEERVFLNHKSSWVVSGAIDVQEMHMELDEDGDATPVLHEDDAQPFVDIYDYKLTSVWAVMNEKSSWEKQINCYAYIIRKSKNRHIGKAYIVAILRDWRRADAEKNEKYPQKPIILVPIRLWSDEEAEDYIDGMVALHGAAREATFSEIPDCDYEERWQQEDSWASMKVGGSRAIKVFTNEAECIDDVEVRRGKARKGDAYEVVKRPGKRVRCSGDYCGVAGWCSTFKQWKKENPDVD